MTCGTLTIASTSNSEEMNRKTHDITTVFSILANIKWLKGTLLLFLTCCQRLKKWTAVVDVLVAWQLLFHLFGVSYLIVKSPAQSAGNILKSHFFIWCSPKNELSIWSLPNYAFFSRVLSTHLTHVFSAVLTWDQQRPTVIRETQWDLVTRRRSDIRKIIQ